MNLRFGFLAALMFAVTAAGEPFTVADSIALTRITTIEGKSRLLPGQTIALFSPAGTHFVVRTRRGDLVNDQNIDQLLLWDTKAVQQFVEAGGKPPEPRVITEQRFHDDWAAMQYVQWLTDDTLGFISNGDNGRQQAFAVNLANGARTQLTNSETDVASFAVAASRVVYFAHEQSSRNGSVRENRGGGIGDFMDVPEGDSSADPRRLFIADSRQSRPTTAPALFAYDLRIWPSPDGLHALWLAPAINAPAHWIVYRTRDNARFAWTEDRISADATSPDLFFRRRYTIVDLRTGEVRPLFDAPDGSLASTRTPSAVFWLKDGRRAIVAHTFLPLCDVPDDERHRRTSSPAIAEVDIESGLATAILWEPVTTDADARAGRRGETIIDVSWDAQSETLNVVRELTDRSRKTERYVRSGDTWQAAPLTAPEPTRLQIERTESPTGRPKLTAGSDGQTATLFDPAPETDRFSFGRIEAITWKDSAGTDWRGALILPVGYKTGQRYPLVIQTHGYFENEFLIDGPGGVTTSFAAQPLANAGFVVLQCGEPAAAITGDGREGRNVANGWAAAIEQLARSGLVDPTRVGVIGWSRTGYHLVSCLAEYPDLVAAAVVADAVQYSYSQLLLTANVRMFADDYDRITGGNPAQIGFSNWFSRGSIYRMQASPAALRVESIGLGSLMSMWETYSLRVMSGRPADFVHFPFGSHVLLKPSERFASQCGSVDWFRFWLKSEERVDPFTDAGETSAKLQTRYALWRALRLLRNTSNRVCPADNSD